MTPIGFPNRSSKRTHTAKPRSATGVSRARSGTPKVFPTKGGTKRGPTGRLWGPSGPRDALEYPKSVPWDTPSNSLVFSLPTFGETLRTGRAPESPVAGWGVCNTRRCSQAVPKCCWLSRSVLGMARNKYMLLNLASDGNHRPLLPKMLPIYSVQNHLLGNSQRLDGSYEFPNRY